MTLAELERWMESQKRQQKTRLKEKATFDYRLADLIGYSVARVHSSNNKLPTIETAYPELFNVKEAAEQRQAQKDMLSALRFQQFAEAHNKKFKEAANS